MNSPQKEPANDVQELNELISILLEGFKPALSPGESDREVSSQELQINLLAHCGIEFTLSQINTAMKNRGFRLRASNSLELEWMLQRA